MNSFIEILNRWGGNFASYAWPMYWQSSLLIVVVLALEQMSRHQLRASIRYGLWLVVLVKLCVPPSLALPTSPAWWVHRAPLPAVKPAAMHYTVTYDDDPMPALLPAAAIDLPARHLTLKVAAIVLVVAAGFSAALLGWLLLRWWQVAQQVSRAEDSGRLRGLALEAQKILGLAFKVQVKVTANSMSPAVCGLFRPVILIPRALAEHFSDEQLRAVMLHELIHLRRRDVWVNFWQSLVQIAYWWHPLVWVANARIRNVREEAVDDAVMLALQDGAEAYAPTLLEVAKVAFNRPLASLGLVGILESRRALRQRIERLVDFRPPRQAGLTLVSLLGLLAFTAVAVPMGQGPDPVAPVVAGAPVDGSSGPVNVQVPNDASTSASSSYVSANSKPFEISAKFYVLSSADFEKVFHPPTAENGGAGESYTGIMTHDHLAGIATAIHSLGIKPFYQPRILTPHGKLAEMEVSDGTKGLRFTCDPTAVPSADGQKVDLSFEVDVTGREAVRGMTSAVLTEHKVSGHAAVGEQEGIIVCGNVSDNPGENKLLGVMEVRTMTNRLSTGTSQGVIIETTNADQVMPWAQGVRETDKLHGAQENAEQAVSLYSSGTGIKYYLARKKRTPGDPGDDGPLGDVLGRNEVIKRIQYTRLASVSYDRVPLGTVLGQLNEKIGRQDPVKLGVRFVAPPDMERISITIQPALTNIAVADVLDAILQTPGRRLKYAIEEGAVEFTWADQSPTLYTRAYAIDSTFFLARLRSLGDVGLEAGKTTNSTIDISEAAKIFFKSLGLNLASPPGKSIFFNSRNGDLMVKATETDLDTLSSAIVGAIDNKPQVHIKARFIEVPAKGFAFPGILTNNSGAGIIGVLSGEETKAVLQMLQAKHATTLAQPEVTTSSGRRARIMATQIISIVTNLDFQESGTNKSMSPQLGTIETGPVLEEVSYVLADGYTINLATTATVTNFLGYDNGTKPRTVYDQAGEKIDVPVVLPEVQVQQVEAHLNLFDGQTAVLEKLESHPVEKMPAFSLKKAAAKPESAPTELLVFITATIVDPVGNRIHSDKYLPFDNIEKDPVFPGQVSGFLDKKSGLPQTGGGGNF